MTIGARNLRALVDGERKGGGVADIDGRDRAHGDGLPLAGLHDPLEHHLPVIGDFWESALFGTGVYARHRRNPLLVHAELDRMSREPALLNDGERRFMLGRQPIVTAAAGPAIM